MTYLQIYEAFCKTCPIKDIEDWRPFGKDTIIVFLKGNRRYKALKCEMLKENKFLISPSSVEEWYRHLSSIERETKVDLDDAEDNAQKAKDGLEIFQRNWCIDISKTLQTKKKEMRCGSCPFYKNNCLVNKFIKPQRKE